MVSAGFRFEYSIHSKRKRDEGHEVIREKMKRVLDGSKKQSLLLSRRKSQREVATF